MCSVQEQGEILLYGVTESAEVYLWKDTGNGLFISCELHAAVDRCMKECMQEGNLCQIRRMLVSFSAGEPTTLRPIPYDRVNDKAHELDVSSLVVRSVELCTSFAHFLWSTCRWT